MTAYTAGYRIPYPTGTDTLCSVVDTLVEAASVIGAALAALEARVALLTVRPALRVSRSSNAVITNGGSPIPFTSVDIDSRAVVNLTRDDLTMFPFTESGIYMHGLDIDVLGVGAGTEAYAGIQNPGIYQAIRDSGVSISGFAGLMYPQPAIATNGESGMAFSTAAVATVTVRAAALWTIRLGARP